MKRLVAIAAFALAFLTATTTAVESGTAHAGNLTGCTYGSDNNVRPAYGWSVCTGTTTGTGFTWQRVMIQCINRYGVSTGWIYGPKRYTAGYNNADYSRAWCPSTAYVVSYVTMQTV